MGRVDIDKIMATVGGVVAGGVALDMIVSRATGRWETSEEKSENKPDKQEKEN